MSEFATALAANNLTQAEYRRIVVTYTQRHIPASTVSLWTSGRNRAPATAYLAFALLALAPTAVRSAGTPVPRVYRHVQRSRART